MGEVADPPATAFAADIVDAEAAARTLFVEEEDGMLTGAGRRGTASRLPGRSSRSPRVGIVAEMIAHMDGAERLGW